MLTSQTRRKITIFVPVFNEVENIELLKSDFHMIAPVVKDFGLDMELLIHDNASTDSSWPEIEKWGKSSDFSFKAFKFERNIGYQQSLSLAFKHASGDAIVVYQSDRQDPIELVVEFIKHWLSGKRVIVGIASNRAESFMEKLGRVIFVWILGKSSDLTLKHWFTDFYCLDRTAYLQLSNQPLMHQFVRGRILELLPVDKQIFYSRNKRTKGVSKFRFTHRYNLALDALLLYGSRIIRRITLLGMVGSFGISIFTFGFILEQLFQNHPSKLGLGFFILFLAAFFMIFLLICGVLLEYQIRIYKQLHTSKAEIFGSNLVADFFENFKD